MIKVLPPPSEAEEYRNTAEILRDWLLKRGSTKHETSSLFVLTISIGWLRPPSTKLQLGFKRFVDQLKMELVATSCRLSVRARENIGERLRLQVLER